MSQFDTQGPAVPARPAMVRQGDVLLVPVDELPPGTTSVRRDAGRVVLAYGEATGHAHAIASAAATQLQLGEDRYLRVDSPVALVHEEHASITVEPGAFRVVIQREFVPPTPQRALGWRPVID